MAATNQKSVLFVCLGNYCRSPMAEAIFKEEIERRGISSEWKVGSCGILGWNVGGGVDDRADHVLTKHRIQFKHVARQLSSSDFNNYYWIFGMDHENIGDIKRKAPENFQGRIELLGNFDPSNELVIRDPYYDRGDEGFYVCYEHCSRSIKRFLDQL